MAFVEMKCPNCGGTMVLKNNQYECSHCTTKILRIIDAKIDADVTVMSPDEFEQKIEESKRQFVVNINDEIKVFDVDTMVINKKLKDAAEKLEQGEFDSVVNILAEVPNNILSAERMRFLSHFKVRNEYELSFYDGYIDVEENDNRYVGIIRKPNERYENIIKLADEQTRATYQKIAQYCREQYDAKKKMESEIEEVNKLLEVGLYKEAVTYAKEMCRRYPNNMMSWSYLYSVKYKVSQNYNGNYEYQMMQKCSDYDFELLPKSLKKDITELSKLPKKYSYITNKLRKKLILSPILSAVFCALFLLLFSLCSFSNIGLVIMSLIPGSYLLVAAAGIAVIVILINLLLVCLEESDIRKEYQNKCEYLNEKSKNIKSIKSVNLKKSISICLIVAMITASVGYIIHKFNPNVDGISYKIYYGSYSVDSCTNRDVIVIPSSYLGTYIFNISSNAFESCSDLEKIFVPKTVKYISSGAFDDCKNMEAI